MASSSSTTLITPTPVITEEQKLINEVDSFFSSPYFETLFPKEESRKWVKSQTKENAAFHISSCYFKSDNLVAGDKWEVIAAQLGQPNCMINQALRWWSGKAPILPEVNRKLTVRWFKKAFFAFPLYPFRDEAKDYVSIQLSRLLSDLNLIADPTQFKKTHFDDADEFLGILDACKFLYEYYLFENDTKNANKISEWVQRHLVKLPQNFDSILGNLRSHDDPTLVGFFYRQYAVPTQSHSFITEAQKFYSNPDNDDLSSLATIYDLPSVPDSKLKTLAGQDHPVAIFQLALALEKTKIKEACCFYLKLSILLERPDLLSELKPILSDKMIKKLKQKSQACFKRLVDSKDNGDSHSEAACGEWANDILSCIQLKLWMNSISSLPPTDYIIAASALDLNAYQNDIISMYKVRVKRHCLLQEDKLATQKIRTAMSNTVRPLLETTCEKIQEGKPILDYTKYQILRAGSLFQCSNDIDASDASLFTLTLNIFINVLINDIDRKKAEFSFICPVSTHDDPKFIDQIYGLNRCKKNPLAALNYFVKLKESRTNKDTVRNHFITLLIARICAEISFISKKALLHSINECAELGKNPSKDFKWAAMIAIRGLGKKVELLADPHISRAYVNALEQCDIKKRYQDEVTKYKTESKEEIKPVPAPTTPAFDVNAFSSIACPQKNSTFPNKSVFVTMFAACRSLYEHYLVEMDVDNIKKVETWIQEHLEGLTNLSSPLPEEYRSAIRMRDPSLLGFFNLQHAKITKQSDFIDDAKEAYQFRNDDISSLLDLYDYKGRLIEAVNQDDPIAIFQLAVSLENKSKIKEACCFYLKLSILLERPDLIKSESKLTLSPIMIDKLKKKSQACFKRQLVDQFDGQFGQWMMDIATSARLKEWAQKTNKYQHTDLIINTSVGAPRYCNWDEYCYMVKRQKKYTLVEDKLLGSQLTNEMDEAVFPQLIQYYKKMQEGKENKSYHPNQILHAVSCLLKTKSPSDKTYNTFTQIIFILLQLHLMGIKDASLNQLAYDPFSKGAKTEYKQLEIFYGINQTQNQMKAIKFFIDLKNKPLTPKDINTHTLVMARLLTDLSIVTVAEIRESIEDCRLLGVNCHARWEAMLSIRGLGKHVATLNDPALSLIYANALEQCDKNGRYRDEIKKYKPVPTELKNEIPSSTPSVVSATPVTTSSSSNMYPTLPPTAMPASISSSTASITASAAQTTPVYPIVTPTPIIPPMYEPIDTRLFQEAVINLEVPLISEKKSIKDEPPIASAPLPEPHEVDTPPPYCNIDTVSETNDTEMKLQTVTALPLVNSITYLALAIDKSPSAQKWGFAYHCLLYHALVLKNQEGYKELIKRADADVITFFTSRKSITDDAKSIKNLFDEEEEIKQIKKLSSEKKPEAMYSLAAMHSSTLFKPKIQKLAYLHLLECALIEKNDTAYHHLIEIAENKNDKQVVEFLRWRMTNS